MNYYCSFRWVITPRPPPTPSLLPPCDILSAHSTTRSLQIPFPWIEFSHNCLVADFAFVRGGNFNKGYINADSRDIKSACVIFCRSPLVTPRQLRPVEAWTQGLWGCPVVSGTRMLEGGSSGWEMGPFMGLTSSGATCGCSMGLRSGVGQHLVTLLPRCIWSVVVLVCG